VFQGQGHIGSVTTAVRESGLPQSCWQRLPTPSLGHLLLSVTVLMTSMDISETSTSTPKLNSVRSLLHRSNGNWRLTILF
ncbi:hypothetical protein, partial [Pseudomonas syringae]|uniref:hypothetical protein n=1 Tax=Pseudomonas syringae TaxID=317 RepID=UPI001F196484